MTPVSCCVFSIEVHLFSPPSRVCDSEIKEVNRDEEEMMQGLAPTLSPSLMGVVSLTST